MHLLLLTQYYPPETGAPQRRLSELSRAFVRRGHRVTVLTAMPSYPAGRVHDGYGGVLRRETLDGVRVVRTFAFATQSPRMLPRMTSYLSFVGASALAGAFVAARPDYLMVESPPLFLGLSALWLRRIKRVPLIFNVSDLWPESAAALGLVSRDSAAFRIARRLEAACYRASALVTGQSREILEDISTRFPHVETHHLSNGVDTTAFAATRADGATTAALRAGTGCAVLYAGLHGIAQGLQQAIDAVAGLEPGTCHLTLVGDGPEKRGLMAAAEARRLTNVSFRDGVPAADVPRLAASADVLIVSLKSYIRGAVPSKLYEAMASERPVLLVAEGEAADIVRRHECGIVVEPGDIIGVTSALRELAGDPDLRARLGANGREAAVRHFDRVGIAARLIDRLETGLNS